MGSCWTESLADCLEPMAINKTRWLPSSKPTVKKSPGKVEVTIHCINCGSHSAVVLPYSTEKFKQVTQEEKRIAQIGSR